MVEKKLLGICVAPIGLEYVHLCVPRLLPKLAGWSPNLYGERTLLSLEETERE
jgi:hypothetical protein